MNIVAFSKLNDSTILGFYDQKAVFGWKVGRNMEESQC